MTNKSYWKNILTYFLSISSKKIIITLLILLLVSLLSSLYIITKYADVIKNSNNVDTTEVFKILNNLSKMIILPNESPQVAKILDVDALKNDPFFSEAKNGDKIIIYKEAKKAIIYRLEENKIINVGPISEQPQSEEKENQ